MAKNNLSIYLVKEEYNDFEDIIKKEVKVLKTVSITFEKFLKIIKHKHHFDHIQGGVFV